MPENGGTFESLLDAIRQLTAFIVVLLAAVGLAESRPTGDFEPLVTPTTMEVGFLSEGEACREVERLAADVVAAFPELEAMQCQLLDRIGICASWTGEVGDVGRITISERALRGGCLTAPAEWVVIHEYGHAWHFVSLDDPTGFADELGLNDRAGWEIIADCFARVFADVDPVRDRCTPEAFDTVSAKVIETAGTF